MPSLVYVTDHVSLLLVTTRPSYHKTNQDEAWELSRSDKSSHLDGSHLFYRLGSSLKQQPWPFANCFIAQQLSSNEPGLHCGREESQGSDREPSIWHGLSAHHLHSCSHHQLRQHPITHTRPVRLNMCIYYFWRGDSIILSTSPTVSILLYVDNRHPHLILWKEQN